MAAFTPEAQVKWFYCDKCGVVRVGFVCGGCLKHYRDHRCQGRLVEFGSHHQRQINTAFILGGDAAAYSLAFELSPKKK